MSRPIVPQTINLKATMDANKVPQPIVYEYFKITPQQLNKWYKGGNMSKDWQERFIKYFNRMSMTIINYN